jgi:hypothetical protein
MTGISSVFVYTDKKITLIQRLVPEESPKSGKDSRVAHLPGEAKSDVIQKIKLRYRAETNLYEQDIISVLKQQNLFSKSHNPKGLFRNSFTDNGDGTITDKVTGLMWQKGGSPSEVTFYTAKKRVEELNEKRFGGHKDWRLPTVEELCSLLKAEPNNNNLHIDRVFDTVQSTCWSSDISAQAPVYRFLPRPMVLVDFAMGDFRIEPNLPRSAYADRYYVRAVRTIE